MKTMNLRAYAKINLFLDITARKENGYHELKTVMQSVGIYDELCFALSEGSGIEISSNRSDLPNDEYNLVYKGIKAVLEFASFSPDCKITVNLKKNIPSGAGMGGGSADCAASIIAVNELFGLGLDSEQMKQIGLSCGADVPFCIEGGTALCEGVGEKITPLPPFENVFFAVAKPDESISTPAAYKNFDEKGVYNAGDYLGFENALRNNDTETIGKLLYNAFTDVCGLKQVGAAIGSLRVHGCLGSQMTGSGSAVFGIFNNKSDAEKALENCECTFKTVCEPKSTGIEII